MKKVVCVMTAFCALFLFACAKEAPEKKNRVTDAPTASAPAAKPQEITLATPTPSSALPIEGEMDFSFLSGAGAWSTDLTLNPDGTFHGTFHDTNAGESGEGHLATIYLSSFSGEFGEFEKINDYTYTMQLTEIHLEKEAGKEWIEEEVRYVAAEPYGLEEGKAFTLYTPDTPLEGLSEEFLSWWPGRWDDELKNGNVLGMYGICNEKTGQGFFSGF